MPRKPRLTHEEHTELGAVLAGMHNELVQRTVQIASAYPKNSMPATKLRAAVRALDQARNKLDDYLFEEFPGVAEATVYYPHPEDRASVAVPTVKETDHA